MAVLRQRELGAVHCYRTAFGRPDREVIPAKNARQKKQNSGGGWVGVGRCGWVWVGVGGWDIQRDSLREGERNSVSQKTTASSAVAQTTNSLTVFPNSQHPTALPHCPTKQPKFQRRLSPSTFQNSPQPTALPNSPKKQPKFQQRPAHRPSRTVNNQHPSPTAQRNKPKASTANSPTDISKKAKAQPTTANRLPQ